MRRRRVLGWHPTDISWRIAALFMVGSALFAVGSLPAYAARIDDTAVAATFFVGSLFFTSAGYSVFYELINRPGIEPAGDGHPRRRYWSLRPGNREWLSAVVQLAGTLWFNISTAAAGIDSLSDLQTDRLVWAPDMYGSIAFLIASHLAWRIVCGRLWCVRTDDDEWWIAALNYVGSICFMTSALASLVLPTTGEVVNIAIVNTGTFGGAVCFFLGARLLLPARARDAS
jgi:hypothetical protein